MHWQRLALIASIPSLDNTDLCHPLDGHKECEGYRQPRSEHNYHDPRLPPGIDEELATLR